MNQDPISLFAGNRYFPAEGPFPPPSRCTRWSCQDSIELVDSDIANEASPVLVFWNLQIPFPMAIVHAERPGLWPFGSRARSHGEP